MKKTLFFTLILGLCCVFLLKWGDCYAIDSFTENWDAYADNVDITTITDWVELVSTSTDARTTSVKAYSGGLSVRQTTTSALHSGHLIDAGNGSYEIYIKMNSGTQNYGVALYGAGYANYGHAFAFNFAFNNLQFDDAYEPCAWDTIDATSLNLSWVDLKIVWRYNGTDIYIEPFINSVSYGEQNCGEPPSAFTHISFYTNYSSGEPRIYFDDVIYSNNPDFPAEIYLTTPESSSTISDDSTELVGGWANIDSTIWTNIKIAFNDLQIGETSGIVNVPITSDNGNFSIPLSQFNIPNNGGWNLRAVVENNYEYNFDIPNPTYNLIFDIEGLPVPYAFTDFETWYSENVEDYEAPSSWALNLTGFLNPVFEKIGQFGDRINSYIDTSTAYEKGLQIGSYFPVIGAYVLKIDLFFGGFPMVAFFKWGVLLMIGLFAVKIILKLLAFIPFVGGGG